MSLTMPNKKFLFLFFTAQIISCATFLISCTQKFRDANLELPRVVVLGETLGSIRCVLNRTWIGRHK